MSLNKKLSDVSSSLNRSFKDVVVPIDRMSFNSAISKANKSKLYIEKGEVKASDKPAGTILSQSIKKIECKTGTVITVTVSSGDKKVEVPYVAYIVRAKQSKPCSL